MVNIDRYRYIIDLEKVGRTLSPAVDSETDDDNYGESEQT